MFYFSDLITYFYSSTLNAYASIQELKMQCNGIMIQLELTLAGNDWRICPTYAGLRQQIWASWRRSMKTKDNLEFDYRATQLLSCGCHQNAWFQALVFKHCASCMKRMRLWIFIPAGHWASSLSKFWRQVLILVLRLVSCPRWKGLFIGHSILLLDISGIYWSNYFNSFVDAICISSPFVHQHIQIKTSDCILSPQL